MHKIHTIPDIPSLLITTELIQQVTSILIAPFRSPDEADLLWAELNCQLWHITDLNNLPTDQPTQDKLLRAIDNIEWIESLDSDTQMSLTIVGDDGQGLYLLLSNNITLEMIKDTYYGN